MSKSTKSAINTTAQALRRIKEVKGRISTLNGRLHQSINWVGEEKPLFDFAKLETERQSLVDELVELKTALLATNSKTELGFEGKTLTVQGAIFLLAELKDQLTLAQSLPVGKEQAEKIRIGHEPVTGKYLYEEVQHHTRLTELERVSRVEQLQGRITELNGLLESVNHRTALVRAHVG